MHSAYRSTPPPAIAAAELSEAPVVKDNCGYDPVLRRWFIFNGKFWDSSDKYAPYPFLDRAMDDMFPQGYSSQFFYRVFRLLKGCLNISVNPYITGFTTFTNGMLNTETGELLEPDREKYIPWGVPYDYVPTAQCPGVQEFLLQCASGDTETVQVLRAFMRGLLTDGWKLNRFLEIVGPGFTGKTAFVHLCHLLVGDDNMGIEFSYRTSNSDFSLATLYKRKLVEFNFGPNRAMGMRNLEALTSGKGFTFRRKYEKQAGPVIFTGMVITTEDKYVVYTDKIRERKLAIRFDNVVPVGKERYLLPEFEAEIEGVASWVLAMDPKKANQLLSGAAPTGRKAVPAGQVGRAYKPH